MDLVSLAKNPVPSGAQTGTIAGYGGVRLRFARWEPTRGPHRGTICLFQGRTEYIEKYFEVVADLRRRGFAVATLDWRGQGGSERLLGNPRKGHVRSFADFDRDLALFMKEVVLPSCQAPYIALAHSMGGNILLRNASDSGSWFSRMVLCAPMVAISPKELRYPPPFPRLFAETMCALGLARTYAPGGSDASIDQFFSPLGNIKFINRDNIDTHFTRVSLGYALLRSGGIWLSISVSYTPRYWR